VTRAEALAALRVLTVGLAPDLAGQARLLERIASHEEHEALRDALTEEGARALLDAEAPS
jgi:hypothetical protein